MNITLTAGHSTEAPGAVYAGLKEADLAAELCRKCVAELTTRGHIVRTDSSGISNAPLGEAIKMINGSDIAIEFHFNAAADSTVGGTEAIALRASKAKAQALAQATSAALGTKLRRDKGWLDQADSAHGKLAYVNMGGIILEVSFLSSANDRALYETNKAALVTALCDTIEGL